MAYVVRRPKGRWEIRESVVTAAGPRARSLASFGSLDRATLDHAAARARGPFDPDSVRAAARKLGAPIDRGELDAAARTIFRLLRSDPLDPGVARLLSNRLEPESPILLDSGDSMAEWVGVGFEPRGAALRDLLDLGDHLPSGDRAELVFPAFAVEANRDADT